MTDTGMEALTEPYYDALRRGDWDRAERAGGAARAAGMRTAFVARPSERGPGGHADLLPDPLADVNASDFIALAAQLGADV